MRTVGRRQEPRISFDASGASFAEGARFNDEIHHLLVQIALDRLRRRSGVRPPDGAVGP
jgi:hypothetical protein